MSMSMHRIPLTPMEAEGLKKHGLPVGTPSQLADSFRLGMSWESQYPRAKPTVPMLLGDRKDNLLLEAWLIKTTKRLTFQIVFQAFDVTNRDINDIKQFRASNGYDIISEHRMDIQSRRIWLLGAENDQPSIRSGTMATPTQALCDDGFTGTISAFNEWANHNDGYVLLHTLDVA